MHIPKKKMKFLVNHVSKPSICTETYIQDWSLPLFNNPDTLTTNNMGVSMPNKNDPEPCSKAMS